MIILGLTGGIASGKTTIVNFLKKKKLAIHDSDAAVKKIYSNPTQEFIKYLKKTSLSNSIKNKKINKKIIRHEIFNNIRKKKSLEKFIHSKVKISRNQFLNKHKKKKTKIVILDIPLLFEAKLAHICDYTALLSCPKKTKIRRAIARKGMKKDIVLKILKHQISDKLKKKKADFVINTSKTKNHSFRMILRIINNIVNINA